MDRSTKLKLKETFVEKLSKANSGIVAEYRGLKVEDLTRLRVELQKLKAEFKVLKNRVVKKAVEDMPSMKEITGSLKGPIGMVICYGDAAQVTKSVLNFAKDNEKFVVKAGVMDDVAVTTNDLKALADLPSREVLFTRLVSSLVSPHRGILGVIQAVPRDLVQVINAIKDKKQA